MEPTIIERIKKTLGTRKRTTADMDGEPIKDIHCRMQYLGISMPTRHFQYGDVSGFTWLSRKIVSPKVN